jgi:hypothetical protein
MRQNSIVCAGILAICSIPGFASLIPIGALPSTGNGLGAVNSLVTFQNTGTEVGCVGVSSTGTMALGSTQCYGGVTAPGGVTNEQTGSGNKIYSPGTLGLLATGANTFANLVLIFNGSEGGNPADSAISLDKLSLNLFSSTGVLLKAFSTTAAYPIVAFTGTGNAGYAFQLDAAQAAQANKLLTDNPTLLIGGSASASNANSGLETVSISRIDSIQPGPSGDPGTATPEPTSLLLMGGGLLGVATILKRRSTNS